MPLSISVIAILLGIVEGLTEFLPVSSTGHLIVFDRLLGFQTMLQNPDKAELFEVVIQLGAILAIGAIYRKKLIASFPPLSAERFRTFIKTNPGQLFINLLIAFLPAAIIGFLTHTFITKYLFGPLTIGITLLVGGILIIVIEKTTKEGDRKITVENADMERCAGDRLCASALAYPWNFALGGNDHGRYASRRETCFRYGILLSAGISNDDCSIGLRISEIPQAAHRRYDGNDYNRIHHLLRGGLGCCRMVYSLCATPPVYRFRILPDLFWGARARTLERTFTVLTSFSDNKNRN